MDKRLKKYLEKQGMTPLDRKVFEDYNKTMVDTVIPEIAKSVKQRERHAMELRFSPFTTSNSSEECD